MSKFKTSFPFDVEAIKKLLPPGAFFAGVEWNKDKNELEVRWEFDTFQTGLDFPLEFPPVALERKQLPKGVAIAEAKRAPSTVIIVRPEGETPEGFRRVRFSIGFPRIVKADFHPDVTQQDIGLADVPADLTLPSPLPTETELDKAVADFLGAKKAAADAEAKARADAEAAAAAQTDTAAAPTEGATPEAPAAAESAPVTDPAPAADVMTTAAETVAKKGKRK